MSKKFKVKPLLNLDDEDEVNPDLETTKFLDNQVLFQKENIMINEKGMFNAQTGELISQIIKKEDLIIDKIIGSGASSSVHIATYKPKNVKVAVKSMNIYDKNKREQFKRDLGVLSDNKCPFLVQFYGTYLDKGQLNLLMEFMNLGSLDDILKRIEKNKVKAPCVPENILAKMTLQILHGLLYLHKVKFQIHRDIKPANILINSDGLVKLTDFGISKQLDIGNACATTYIGTIMYMSPERLLGTGCSYDSDVWSLGLIVYQLASGKMPYNLKHGESRNIIVISEKMKNYPPPSLPEDGPFSPELNKFLDRCLQYNMKNRASVIELLNHPWIKKFQFSEGDVANWLAEFYQYKLE